MPGLLIAFCGIDGSGKSTQLRRLAASLGEAGYDVLRTRQPTDTYRANPLVRQYLDTGQNAFGGVGLALLAAADRQYHLETVVRPAMERGATILCDRYVYSSIAYFAARGVPMSFVVDINAYVPKPGLTVLLDVDPADARARVAARDGKIAKFEEKDLGFMATVRKTFQALADDSFLVLDACEPEDRLAERILDRVTPLLPNITDPQSVAAAR
jgi:dTMP kinase